MRRLIVLLGLIIVCSASQGQGNPFDKFYFGGGLGFNAGSDFTTISLSPQLGYKITERLSAGVGITYQYTDYKNIDLTLTHYGGSLFSRYLITDQIFAHTEYEYLTIEFPTDLRDLSKTQREGYNSWFVGGGFVQPLGRNAAFTTVALYNVLYDDSGNSPYNSPFVVRAGFNIGF
ncbi:MAG: hypothetical protein KI790_12320 [Cyclobacteriaceae bacterium]|nr:hypothetical protein [Cyclobacteriaceae bacterium HetDA_MAG_MS6]